MSMRRLVLALLGLTLLGWTSAAQTSPPELFQDTHRAWTSHYPYPGPSQQALTPAPAGYEPFYISHYGRHGSRQLTDNAPFVQAIGTLDSAARLGILTPRGEEVLSIVKAGYEAARGRDGDLTALGARQHREIARRMYDRFPQLLSRPLQVDARSSTSRRCMISMFNFCGELKGLNPALDFQMDASSHDMPFVVGNADLKPAPTPDMPDLQQQVSALLEKASESDRLLKVLFTDVARAESSVDTESLGEALFDVAGALLNHPELNLSLTELFTREELFSVFKAYNAGVLLKLGLIPGSTPMYLGYQEVRDSIESVADRVIRTGQPALTLRFSHDGSLIRLAYLMGLKEAMGGSTDFDNLHRYISIDRIIPMAANIQLVFYRKEGAGDILVKFLLNENETTLPIPSDTAPYYRWTDVKQFWAKHPETRLP